MDSNRVWVILQEDGTYSSTWWHVSGVITTGKQEAIDNSKYLLVCWILETFARYKHRPQHNTWTDKDLHNTLSYITLERDCTKFSGFRWYLKLGGKDIPNLTYACEDYQIIGKEVYVDQLGLMPEYDDTVLYIDI